MDLRLTLVNIFDIALVTSIIFFTMRWIISNSRALQIIKGAVVIIFLKMITDYFNLASSSTILQSILIWGPLILIILLQPEIRSGLETLADTRRFVANKDDGKSTLRIISEVAFEFAKEREGAIFVIENKTPLSSYASTGIKIDAEVSKSLLRNIFEKTSNMHDGAAIIVNNRLDSVSVILPLSTNQLISQKYGTRHRSALGISEETDSISIIVSEERGQVSITYRGELEVVSNAISLRSKIEEILFGGKEDLHA